MSGSDAKPETRSLAFKVRANPRIWAERFGVILKKNGVEECPTWNWFQREVNRIYLWCRKHGKPFRIVIVKPRQRGSSTVGMALLYTHARNFVANCAVLGDDLNTTAKLMEYFDRYCVKDRFGEWGNAPKTKANREFTHGSTVKEETANDPRAGMGGTIHFLLASEAAHYKRKGRASGEVVMMSIMQSVPDLPNTGVIIESTANGANGVFYETYRGAVTFEEYQAGTEGNGYIRVFAPWYSFDDSEVMGMTDEQKARVLATLDADPRFPGEMELVEVFGVRPEQIEWRRRAILGPGCNGDYRKFDQEQPKDDRTCFLQSGTSRFDPVGIEHLSTELLLAPATWRHGVLEKPHGDGRPVFCETAIADAWIRINEMPKNGCRYVGSSDYMTGEQASAARRETDCHATGILRAAYTDPDGAFHKSRVVAAFLPDDRLKDIDILTERQGLLNQFYGSCPFAPEINKHGDALISLLRKAGANVWSRKRAGNGGKTVQIPGFEMNETTKIQVISELATIIREQEIEIPCKRMVDELQNFITWPNGKDGAADGWHDDWVICLAIAIHILPTATTFESTEQVQARKARLAAHSGGHLVVSSGLVAEHT